jgi:hypothetical protein
MVTFDKRTIDTAFRQCEKHACLGHETPCRGMVKRVACLLAGEEAPPLTWHPLQRHHTPVYFRLRLASAAPFQLQRLLKMLIWNWRSVNWGEKIGVNRRGAPTQSMVSVQTIVASTLYSRGRSWSPQSSFSAS